MKKYALLLVAAAIVGFTSSCGSNENNASNEQIDSMANYRADTMEAALKAQNDSLINAMAQMRADSAMRAENMAKGGSKTTTTTTTKTVRPTKPVETRHSTPTNVNDRPGGNGASTDQKGRTTNDNTPKNVNDRPGGN